MSKLCIACYEPLMMWTYGHYCANRTCTHYGLVTAISVPSIPSAIMPDHHHDTLPKERGVINEM